jgi:hypothetical protein
LIAFTAGKVDIQAASVIWLKKKMQQCNPQPSAETEDRDTPFCFLSLFCHLFSWLDPCGNKALGWLVIMYPLRVSTALGTSRPLPSFPFTFVFLVSRIMFTAFTKPDLICDKLSDETGDVRPARCWTTDDTPPRRTGHETAYLGAWG